MASAITVAVIASCHHDPSPDQRYLGAVHAAGLRADGGDAEFLRVGHEVCHRLDVGEPADYVVGELWKADRGHVLSYEKASEVVADALEFLCPEQVSHYHGR